MEKCLKAFVSFAACEGCLSVCLFFSSLWWTDPMHLHSSERECVEGLESSLRIPFLFITLINVMAQSHLHSHQRLEDLQSSDELDFYSVVFFLFFFFKLSNSGYMKDIFWASNLILCVLRVEQCFSNGGVRLKNESQVCSE